MSPLQVLQHPYQVRWQVQHWRNYLKALHLHLLLLRQPDLLLQGHQCHHPQSDLLQRCLCVLQPSCCPSRPAAAGAVLQQLRLPVRS
jgi:hypothetical protein